MTHLLAATAAYYINRTFGRKCTMLKVQKKYMVRSKQISVYITGGKYLRGSHKRKRKNAPAETAMKDLDNGTGTQ